MLCNSTTRCPEEDAKKNYRRLALEFHPDKGGKTEDFTHLTSCYKSLYEKPSEEAASGGSRGTSESSTDTPRPPSRFSARGVAEYFRNKLFGEDATARPNALQRRMGEIRTALKTKIRGTGDNLTGLYDFPSSSSDNTKDIAIRKASIPPHLGSFQASRKTPTKDHRLVPRIAGIPIRTTQTKKPLSIGDLPEIEQASRLEETRNQEAGFSKERPLDISESSSSSERQGEKSPRESVEAPKKIPGPFEIYKQKKAELAKKHRPSSTEPESILNRVRKPWYQLGILGRTPSSSSATRQDSTAPLVPHRTSPYKRDVKSVWKPLVDTPPVYRIDWKDRIERYGKLNKNDLKFLKPPLLSLEDFPPSPLREHVQKRIPVQKMNNRDRIRKYRGNSQFPEKLRKKQLQQIRLKEDIATQKAPEPKREAKPSEPPPPRQRSSMSHTSVQVKPIDENLEKPIDEDLENPIDENLEANRKLLNLFFPGNFYCGKSQDSSETRCHCTKKLSEDGEKEATKIIEWGLKKYSRTKRRGACDILNFVTGRPSNSRMLKVVVAYIGGKKAKHLTLFFSYDVSDTPKTYKTCSLGLNPRSSGWFRREKSLWLNSPDDFLSTVKYYKDVQPIAIFHLTQDKVDNIVHVLTKILEHGKFPAARDLDWWWRQEPPPPKSPTRLETFSPRIPAEEEETLCTHTNEKDCQRDSACYWNENNCWVRPPGTAYFPGEYYVLEKPTPKKKMESFHMGGPGEDDKEVLIKEDEPDSKIGLIVNFKRWVPKERPHVEKSSRDLEFTKTYTEFPPDIAHYNRLSIDNGENNPNHMSDSEIKQAVNIILKCIKQFFEEDDPVNDKCFVASLIFDNLNSLKYSSCSYSGVRNGHYFQGKPASSWDLFRLGQVFMRENSSEEIGFLKLETVDRKPGWLVGGKYKEHPNVWPVTLQVYRCKTKRPMP